MFAASNGARGSCMWIVAICEVCSAKLGAFSLFNIKLCVQSWKACEGDEQDRHKSIPGFQKSDCRKRWVAGGGLRKNCKNCSGLPAVSVIPILLPKKGGKPHIFRYFSWCFISNFSKLYHLVKKQLLWTFNFQEN